MTTPPDPPPSGAEREDQAAAAGAEAAAAIAEATAVILATMAATIAAVAAGTLSVAAARRKVRAAVSGALGGASRKLKGIFSRAAQRASAGGQAAAGQPQELKAGKAGSASKQPPVARSGGRASGGKQEIPGLPPVPDAPKAIADAILTAQQDAGQAFEAAMYAALGGKGGAIRPQPGPYRDVVEKAMRRLTGIGEDVKDLTGSERAKQSLSRLQAAQVVMNDLASRGLTGFTDSAGRRWELGAYAEMATRTASSRMHLASQLSMMAQAGNRLVIVDDPSMTAPCPRCRPWVGRVVALYGEGSGESTITDASGTKRTETIAGTLAEAVAAGLHHPNCRCTETPWADGAGMVPTVGGQERGYVEGGKRISKPLPIGTEQDYINEQRLRAHERAVRANHARVLGALTPQAKAKARLHLAASRQALEAHVKATGVTRLKGRERAGKAR